MSRLRSSLLASVLCPLFCTGQLFALAYDVSDRPAKACSSENKTVEITSTEPHQKAIDGAVAQTPPEASNPSRNTLDTVAESLGGTVNGLMRFLGGTVNGLVRSVEGTAHGLGRSVEGTVHGFGRSLDRTGDGLGRFLDDSGEVALEVVEGTAAVAVVAGVVFLFMMAESHHYHGHGYHH